MKSFALVMASLIFPAMTPMFDQRREDIAFKFCEDVWLSRKSDDQIIQQYLVKNTNKEVSDSDRKSLIKLSLVNLRDIKPAGSISGIKVQPYSEVTPISGLDIGFKGKDVYAITEYNKVVFYTLFENDRIASFIIVKKGQKSYFLTF